MKKCVIYARVSSENYTKQKQNLQSQIDQLTEYARRHEYKVCEVFHDDASSAQAGMPAFGYMLENIRRGNIKTIFCTDIDRVIRSFCDWKDIYKLIQNKKVKVIKSKKK